MRDKRTGGGISSRDEPHGYVIKTNETNTEGGDEGNFARVNCEECCGREVQDQKPPPPPPPKPPPEKPPPPLKPEPPELRGAEARTLLARVDMEFKSLVNITG